jgi:hypothetical protein
MRPSSPLTAFLLALLLTAGTAAAPRAQEAADPHHAPDAAEPAPAAPEAAPMPGGMPLMPPPGRGMGMMGGPGGMMAGPGGMMGGPGGMMGMMGAPGPHGMMHREEGPTDPVAAAFAAINRRMHRDMVVEPGTSPDAAFAKAMIAHHQGAIDMAKVVLGFGKDPEIRKLAEVIIAAQEQEIATLRQWLARQPQ